MLYNAYLSELHLNQLINSLTDLKSGLGQTVSPETLQKVRLISEDLYSWKSAWEFKGWGTFDALNSPLLKGVTATQADVETLCDDEYGNKEIATTRETRLAMTAGENRTAPPISRRRAPDLFRPNREHHPDQLRCLCNLIRGFNEKVYLTIQIDMLYSLQEGLNYDANHGG